jgi:hypothetical protein
MQDNMHTPAGDECHDDVSGLFQRLGSSQGADGYRNFAPAQLPSRPVPAVVARQVERPVAAPPLVVAESPVRQLRPVEAGVEPASAPRAASTSLEQLFRRLASTDASTADGLVKRLLTR